MSITMRTRPCPMCSKSKLINGTLEQIVAIKSGKSASIVFPNLSDAEKRNIDTGLCLNCSNQEQATFQCLKCKYECVYPVDGLANICDVCEIEMERI